MNRKRVGKMTDFDLVDKLRERANVSYEEARAALDATGGDLLDALIYLERQGRVAPPPSGGSYSSKSEPTSARETVKAPASAPKGESFNDMMRRFCRWCGDMVKRGNANYFQIFRRGERIVSIPVTVLVLLFVFVPHISFPLMIVGLFLGCRYSFSGSEIERTGVNSVMDSAANIADNVKNEVRREVESARQNNESAQQNSNNEQGF